MILVSSWRYPDPDPYRLKWIWIRPNDTDPYRSGSRSGSTTLEILQFFHEIRLCPRDIEGETVQLAWLSEVSQAWPEMQTCLMTLINPSTWYLTLDICGAIEPSSEVGTARWVGKGRELPRIPDLMTANKPTRKPTKLILMHCSHLQTGIGYPWHNE